MAKDKKIKTGAGRAVTTAGGAGEPPGGGGEGYTPTPLDEFRAARAAQGEVDAKIMKGIEQRRAEVARRVLDLARGR